MELNEISVTNPLNINTSKELLNMRNFQILAEGPQVSQDLNIRHLPIVEEGPQVSQDLNMRNFQILEEGPRVCPLCSQEIRLYFINYHEKIEMCENLECDYPFGYEPLKILREENGVQTVEVKSITTRGNRSMTGSQNSSQAWSDVDKLCNVFEPDDSSIFNKMISTPQPKKSDSDKRREELLRNVEKIKQMTKSMNDMKNESKRIIKNEKWIKNLQYLQSLSGLNLLRPAEMKKIKKKNESAAGAPLKIEIDRNDLTHIKIEVNRTVAPDHEIV